jgi:hypothetical protein
MNATRLLTPVILLAASVPARATPAVGLAYDAPAGCPSEDDFVAAVTGRGADFDAPRGTPVAEVMVVSISRAENGFAGAFQVRDGGEATNKREVRGASCREVADALAVVTAIALQGDAGGGGKAQPAPASSPPRVTEVSPGPDPAPASPPPPQPSKRLRGRTRLGYANPESVTVPAGTIRFEGALTWDAYAGAAVGIIPSLVLPHYDIAGIVANFVTTPDGAQRIAGIVLRTHVGIMGPGTYRSSSAKTDVIGGAFGIDLCQSPRYDTGGLVLLFCVGYAGGFMNLNTTGLDGTSIQTKTAGFGEVALSGEIQYYLGAGFHVAARLGGGFAVGQLTAEGADGSRIFASQPWSGDFMLGVGRRF